MVLENLASLAPLKIQLSSMASVAVASASLWMEEILTSVPWTLTYVPMGSVKTCEAATAVTATVAMNQMPQEEIALTLMNAWLIGCFVTTAYAEIPLAVTAARVPLAMCSGRRQRPAKM